MREILKVLDKDDWTKISIALTLIASILIICYASYYIFIEPTEKVIELLDFCKHIWYNGIMG